jgi:CRISPR-associated protein Cmr4
MNSNLINICSLKAISPCHAGSGSATSHVDLPIQRERHTNWPHIQASAVKGAIRAHYREFAQQNSKELINIIFGSDDGNDRNMPGSSDGLAAVMAVSDVNLLAFPMRSNIAPFVRVTCPAVLARLATNLELAGIKFPHNWTEPLTDEAFVLRGDISGNVVLEDALVTARPAETPCVLPEGFPEMDHLLLVSNEVFEYCVSSCTEVQTNIKIDSETGTAQDTGLRYEELLPCDTILYMLASFSGKSFNEGQDFKADTIRKHICDTVKDFIQIGGDQTLGRGIFKLCWIEGGA